MMSVGVTTSRRNTTGRTDQAFKSRIFLANSEPSRHRRARAGLEKTLTGYPKELHDFWESISKLADKLWGGLRLDRRGDATAFEPSMTVWLNR